jgi:NADPH-dependent 2,4-dienoyl-CoA reductase/sulfur reductase-like enzyme
LTSKSQPEDVLIIGASLAGSHVARTLRTAGFEGPIRLIGDEPYLPYDRPVLSKAYLSDLTVADTPKLYSTASELRESDVDIRLGQAALALNVSEKTVRLKDETLPYSVLVIATGSHERRLPQAEGFGGVFTLRTYDQAIELRQALSIPARLTIVGFGLIGAEVASTARKLGHSVTIVDAAPGPFHRFGTAISQAVESLHRDQGAIVKSGVTVASVIGGSRVEAVQLSNGEVIETDLLLTAVGASPTQDWLAKSDLKLGDGINCDSRLRATPSVYAAGDIARWHNPLFDRSLRVQHWTNAVEQGRYVARDIVGANRPGTGFEGVPYFWSDQHDQRIQGLGILPTKAEPCTVYRDADKGLLSLYSEQQRIVGVAGINATSTLMKLRTAVIRRAEIESVTKMIETETAFAPAASI